jgi:uncharacterized membrane protein
VENCKIIGEIAHRATAEAVIDRFSFYTEGRISLLKLMRRYTSFAFLMALVIGWSSVAFAVQKPIHLLMMSQASAQSKAPQLRNAQADNAQATVSQMDTVAAHSVPHGAVAKHDSAAPQAMAQQASSGSAASNMQMQDCHQGKTSLQPVAQASEHCQTNPAPMGSNMQCADCALWHCQIASVSLEMHAVQFSLPELKLASEQPNITYTAQYLPGHWQELLRPPKA